MAGGDAVPGLHGPGARAGGGGRGGGAGRRALLLRGAWGVLLSLAVGFGIAAFEAVETLVVGLDVWLHALGLTAAPGKGLPGTSLEGVPAPLGVPLPLWLQPAYFALGCVIVALALRLRAHQGHRARSRPGPRLAAGRSGTSGSGGPATPAARVRPSALAGLALRPVPALLGFAGLWAVFLLVLHPWMMGWGATPEERAMALPGDGAAPRRTSPAPSPSTPRPPPSGRGCWPSARTGPASTATTGWRISSAATSTTPALLRPEWQQRAVGDRVPMAGTALQRLGGEYTRLTVRTLEPERVLADVPGRFVLLPRGEEGTRLLLREPLAIPERGGLAWLVWDPMHFVMEQRMLRGIKERTEARPLVPPPVQAAARAGWALAGAGLLAVFLARRRRWPWLLLPAGPSCGRSP